MATEETRRSRSPKKNRGINWPDEATEALLELWTEESIQRSLGHAKSSKETRAVYENLKGSYIIVVWVHYRSYREITLILKNCNLLKNIMLSEEHSSALSMELFLWIVSFVFCNMLFRNKSHLLAFCMYVGFKWKIYKLSGLHTANELVNSCWQTQVGVCETCLPIGNPGSLCVTCNIT